MIFRNQNEIPGEDLKFNIYDTLKLRDVWVVYDLISSIR